MQGVFRALNCLRCSDVKPAAVVPQAPEPFAFDGAVIQEIERKRAFRSRVEEPRMKHLDAGEDEAAIEERVFGVITLARSCLAFDQSEARRRAA